MLPRVSFSGKAMMVILCVTNMINYVDRGIVPGAADKFDAFIEDTMGSSGVNAYFGALQSAFIVGFSLGSMVVGHLVHTQPPFRLAAYGLTAWIVAVALAGISKRLRSYELLLCARAASGLGEAGFVTVGGPYIQDVAGKQQGLWLGAFYSAIPLGTAVGYGYGAEVAVLWNWSLCFFIEAVAMVPLALCFLLSKDDGSASFNASKVGKLGGGGDDDEDDASLHRGGDGIVESNPLRHDDDDDRVGGGGDDVEKGENAAAAAAPSSECDEVYSLEEDQGGDDGVVVDDGVVGGRRRHRALAIATPQKKKKKEFGVWEEIWLCLRQPTFAWVALGYAGYAGSLLGFSTFAPSIVVGLGLWSSMPAASIAFSGTIAASGIIGTPVGGLLLDSYSQKQKSGRQLPALDVALACVGSGGLLVLFAAIARTQALFLFLLFLGTLPLFAATSPMNVALFDSVPHDNRAFGQALGVLVMHAFGDVPTPIIVGALKDRLAPACTLGRHDNDVDEDCAEQRNRLRLIGVGCAAWLVFSLLGFAIARARAGDAGSSSRGCLEAPLLGGPLANDDDDLDHDPPTVPHASSSSPSDVVRRTKKNGHTLLVDDDDTKEEDDSSPHNPPR